MEKTKNINLTSGSILKQLFLLAVPIIGTSFVQTAYNLIDMFWIGFLGANAVAAVGIAGFFVWLSNGITLLSRTGTEIRVAQYTGAGEDEEAKRYAKAGLFSVIAIALVFTLLVYGLRDPLVSFFRTKDNYVDQMSKDYLKVVSLGFVFAFFNQVMTGVFNGRGNSSFPFRLNTFGLVINIL
ncbi:MAG: MATE family efflux transporter, partial [Vallitaleaceae bacterium]|nr:MATE family efflux transporter [Vallitaleaceae bacterium]